MDVTSTREISEEQETPNQENEGNGNLSHVDESQRDTSSEDFKTEISEDQIKLIEEGIQLTIDENFFSMNGFKIKKDFPKVFEVLCNFLNIKSKVGALDDETVIGTLLYAPRTVLPEFFDEKKMFINLTYIEIGPTNWKYTITEPSVGVTISADLYPSRAYAENAAYYTAFRKLENQLT
jgi:hypothetical protein